MRRVRDAGIKVIHQVHTVGQARVAAALGVDVIIAQGSEAGGQGMAAGIGALALLPQVVDAVGPIPVLLAGGVADGRGLAAALTLGGAGVNVGTRFLASEESGADPSWREQILAAESEEAVRFEAWHDLFPPAPSSYDVVPRVMRTEFVTRWTADREGARRQAQDLRRELMDRIRAGLAHELTPFTGQTAGLIGDVRPAAEIVRGMVSEAAAALARAAAMSDAERA